ncbi:MAG: hypothetical protein M1819_004273 [Sarea resinae]|nr:MAG: hypothetical protein M1819_004273 [Sarea resinae]
MASGATPWTPVVVKTTEIIGHQRTPDITNVSRDGGFSFLIEDKVVWVYDDTQCMSEQGRILSFVSNSAAYASNVEDTISEVRDFHIEEVRGAQGREGRAIEQGDAVNGGGGWIPFNQDEIDFNNDHRNRERIAIWPATAPTALVDNQAFIFAPLTYVDELQQHTDRMFKSRGITLVSIELRHWGPQATRQNDLMFPDTEVPFGGFSAVVGYASTDRDPNRRGDDTDIYVLGKTASGLQLARAPASQIMDHDAYKYYEPRTRTFTDQTPDPNITGPEDLYLTGSFSNGNLFWSPYFGTFVLVYFNHMADSKFYMRYLDLDNPLNDTSAIWTAGGRLGNGIQGGDAEALIRYAWSPEQEVFATPPGPGGYNYAGQAHPEYFNRQYYPRTAFTPTEDPPGRLNRWFGSSEVEEDDAGGDGKHLLVSWTSQIRGGTSSGIYEIMLARIEFGDIPPKPGQGEPPRWTTLSHHRPSDGPPGSGQSSSDASSQRFAPRPDAMNGHGPGMNDHELDMNGRDPTPDVERQFFNLARFLVTALAAVLAAAVMF